MPAMDWPFTGPAARDHRPGHGAQCPGQLHP
jgi:hypothetical protein